MTRELPLKRAVSKDRGAPARKFGRSMWWSAFGIQGRFGMRLASPNAGTKPGYAHKPHGTLQQRRDFRHGQIAAEGRLGELASGQRCVPPHVKVRAKLEQPRPLNSTEREMRYGPTPTPAQARRTRKKRNHAVAKAAGR
jgi:hypothetical protein